MGRRNGYEHEVDIPDDQESGQENDKTNAREGYQSRIFFGKGALDLCLHYGASKAAVMHMTRIIAFEWSRFNINVNCIAPGFFATEMTKVQQEDERNRTLLIDRIPFKRFGKPEEIVGLAIFLSSAAADYITGETIFIDGGYSIW